MNDKKIENKRKQEGKGRRRSWMMVRVEKTRTSKRKQMVKKRENKRKQ